jgi:hypothetical protein
VWGMIWCRDRIHSESLGLIFLAFDSIRRSKRGSSRNSAYDMRHKDTNLLARLCLCLGYMAGGTMATIC